jgi:hypothetical protein
MFMKWFHDGNMCNSIVIKNRIINSLHTNDTIVITSRGSISTMDFITLTVQYITLDYSPQLF